MAEDYSAFDPFKARDEFAEAARLRQEAGATYDPNKGPITQPGGLLGALAQAGWLGTRPGESPLEDTTPSIDSEFRQHMADLGQKWGVTGSEVESLPSMAKPYTAPKVSPASVKSTGVAAAPKTLPTKTEAVKAEDTKPSLTKDLGGTESQTPGTTFPEFKLTESMSPEEMRAELMKAAEGIPRTVEELAGPRPERPRTGLLQGALIGFGRGAAGLSPAKMEEALQARLDTQYAQNVAQAQARQKAMTDAQLKALDYKQKYLETKRAREAEGIAKMGENAPWMAQNPNFTNALMQSWGIPADAAKLAMKDMIDPKTGQFKPGASLSMTPETKFNWTMQQGMSIAKKNFGITDPMQAAQIVLNPAEWLKYNQDYTNRIKNRISELDKIKNPTEVQKEERQKLVETFEDFTGKNEQLWSINHYHKTIRAADEEYEKSKAQILKAYPAGGQRDQAIRDITNEYNRATSAAMDNLAGGSAYIRGMLALQKATTAKEVKADPRENNMDYQAGIGIFPQMSKDFAGTEGWKNWEDYQSFLDIARSIPKGQNVRDTLIGNKNPAIARTARILMGTDGYWYKTLTGAGLGPALAAAAKSAGGVEKIPVDNLVNAMAILTTQRDANAASKALLAGLR